MNLQLLSAQIVNAVHRSEDSVINLETVVANLIRDELERDRKMRLASAIDKTSLLLREYERDFDPNRKPARCVNALHGPANPT